MKRNTYRNKLNLILFTLVCIPIMILSFVFLSDQTTRIYSEVDDSVYIYADSANEKIKEYAGTVLQKVRFITSYHKINECLMMKEKEVITGETIKKNSDINFVLNAMFSDYNLSEYCIYTTNPNATKIGMIKIMDEEQIGELNVDDDSSMWRIEEKNMQNYICYYKKYVLIDGYVNIIRISTPARQLISGFTGNPFKKMYVNLSLQDGSWFSFCFEDGGLSRCEIPERASLHEINYSIPSINGLFRIYLDKNIMQIQIIKVWGICILAAVIILFLIILLVWFVSANITHELTEIVSSIDLDDLSAIESVKIKSNEFEIIRNYLISLKNRLEKESEERLAFQTQMLSQRITPHFIYNNLSAIKSTCNNPFTRKAVDRFVSYCRRIFSNKNKFIALSEEILNTVEYLKVMQFCYGISFEIESSCSKLCAAAPVPVNILQPIAENAFIHGINTMPDDFQGNISIHAKMEDCMIRIAVEDNAGQLNMDKIKGNENHALDIIKKQIALYYNNDPACGIAISGSDDRTSVVIRLRCEA